MNDMNVYQKIHGIMSELHYIAKSDKTVNEKYRFVSHDQVAAKLHPLLVKFRLVMIPSVESVIQDANRTSVTLLINFINIDKPEDSFSIKMLGYGIDPSDKGPGKAISYAFKYGALKTFCLETGDDPDNDTSLVYEPLNSQIFDSRKFDDIIEGLDMQDHIVMVDFVKHCAKKMNTTPEKVMEEAVKKPEKFLQAFEKWRNK